jgi:hypothetical protein
MAMNVPRALGSNVGSAGAAMGMDGTHAMIHARAMTQINHLLFRVVMFSSSESEQRSRMNHG